MSGQVVGMINDDPTCAELMQRIIREFHQGIKTLNRFEEI